MAIMNYDKELTAIGTWVKATTGLNSWKLKEAPSVLPRPVIIWDNPGRGKPRNVSRYEYIIPVMQYGRLCVKSVEQAIDYQDKLITDLEERCGVIPVVEDGLVLRKLKAAQIEFTGHDLEGAFTLSYEISYHRTQPAEVPHATTVTNRVATEF